MLNRLSDIREMAIAIAENSAQGIVVMDDAGYCLYANRAWTEITGFATEDMRAKPVHDWVHHRHPDGRPFPIEECPIGCTLGKHEHVRNHRDLFFKMDGSPFHVSCAASPIIREGMPVLKILEIRDISQDVETERRKDEFLAMLAHELRNPLAPISAAADLLQVGRLDDASVRQSSRIIARQVSHMTGLIDDLLDVSRVTRGQVELDRQTHDIRTVIADATEQMRPLIDARRHWIAVNTSPGAAMVQGDRKRLVQVFANILGNAAKYTPDGGEIAVSIEVLPESVQVTVADNGIGMTPEMCARAFDMFSQAQRPSDRAQGGLGIGLALVRSLVSLHGGTVAIRSEGLDAGTAVTVRLPRCADAPGASAAEHGDDGIPVTEQPLNILVVEDAKDAADTLGMLLRALGHEVRLELDPYAALQAASDGTYDAFLLDVGLPGMDGLELARRIRQQPQHAGALLIAITGYGQANDRRAAFDAGFDHHLVKPADLRQLRDVLNRPRNGSADVA